MTKFKECACEDEDKYYYIPSNDCDTYYYIKEKGKLSFSESINMGDGEYKNKVLCCSVCKKEIEFEDEDIK